MSAVLVSYTEAFTELTGIIPYRRKSTASGLSQRGAGVWQPGAASKRQSAARSVASALRRTYLLSKCQISSGTTYGGKGR